MYCLLFNKILLVGVCNLAILIQTVFNLYISVLINEITELYSAFPIINE